LKCDRGRVLAEAVIIEVRQRSCVKFGRGRVKASVTEVEVYITSLGELVVKSCVELLRS